MLRAIQIIALATAVGAAGCGQRLPTYVWVDHATALSILAQRASKVQSVSGECLLTLHKASGESIRLDAAMVAQPPDHLRLRAWKLGQAVFDLTMTPQGLWVMAPQDAPQRHGALPASLSAARFARGWSMLSADFFTAKDLVVEDDGTASFHLKRQVEEEQTFACDVDRATLTVRQYSLTDAAGVAHFTLRLDRYRALGEVAWPMQITAVSDAGQIQVTFEDVELNGAVAANAFVPPRRAEKLP